MPGNGYFFYMSSDAHSENNLDNILNKYRAFISNVRYRHDSEIPTEPGFCFQNGFVADDGKTSQSEIAQLKFRLKDNPDVVISIDSIVSFVEDDEGSLLERMKKVRSDLVKNKAKILSEKSRKINEIKGEEFLMYLKLDGDIFLGHKFIWESQEELNNPLKPGLHLEITTATERREGGSSLTTEQVQALYETIVRSIRIRPVTESPQPNSTPAAKP